MARRKIPEDRLTEEQRKRRERNERYRNRRDLVLVASPQRISSQRTEKDQSKTRIPNPVQPQEEAVSNQRQEIETAVSSIESNLSSLFPLQASSVPVSSASKWEELFEKISSPEQVLLGLCVLILSSYLTFQSFSFFLTMESRQTVALIDALISEFVLVLLAASLAFCSKKVPRFLIGSFLLATILGLGVFLHRSLSENFAAKSFQVAMLLEEKDLTTKAIGLHTTNIEALPLNFVAKRQEHQRKLDEERTKLSELNKRLTLSRETAVADNTSRVSYAFWLRLAAMLLNAYLVHCLFSRLRQSCLESN